MIWRRQVKQRMARVKVHLFLFRLKFVKMKIFFYRFSPQTTELRKMYLCSIQMIKKTIEKDSFRQNF